MPSHTFARVMLPACYLCAAALTAANAATPTSSTPSNALSAGLSATAPLDVIAQGGSFGLSGADVRALVENLPASQRAAATNSTASLEQVVRAELVRRAVLAEAKNGNFAQQQQTAATLDRVRDEALTRLWVANQAQVPADYPSEEQIANAYETNKAALAAPTEYRIGQIFISAPDGTDPVQLSTALKKAADVGTKLAANSDFSDLARRFSDNSDSASKGGDLGYLPDNRVPPDILTVIRNLKPAEVAGPIKTGQGLQFLKLLDKKPGAVPTLAEAHDRIAALLRARRAQELEQTYLTSLNSKLGVSVNQIALAKLQQTLSPTPK